MMVLLGIAVTEIRRSIVRITLYGDTPVKFGDNIINIKVFEIGSRDNT
jgi:hypothetical protein